MPGMPTLMAQKEDVILGIYIAWEMLLYLGERRACFYDCPRVHDNALRAWPRHACMRTCADAVRRVTCAVRRVISLSS